MEEQQTHQNAASLPPLWWKPFKVPILDVCCLKCNIFEIGVITAKLFHISFSFVLVRYSSWRTIKNVPVLSTALLQWFSESPVLILSLRKRTLQECAVVEDIFYSWHQSRTRKLLTIWVHQLVPGLSGLCLQSKALLVFIMMSSFNLWILIDLMVLRWSPFSSHEECKLISLPSVLAFLFVIMAPYYQV